MNSKFLLIFMVLFFPMSVYGSNSLIDESSFELAKEKHKSVADEWVHISQTQKNLNVHSISKTFIRSALPTLYEVDEILRGETPAMTWRDFQRSLDSFNIFFSKMGPRIKNYYGIVDKESLAHMDVLMTRVWSLAQWFEDGPTIFQMNIESNIYEGGGCCAGVAVRLTQLYINLLGQLIDIQGL